MSSKNYQKRPFVEIPSFDKIYDNWQSILTEIFNCIQLSGKASPLIALELYHGVNKALLIQKLKSASNNFNIIDVDSIYLDQQRIILKTYDELTDDPVFGKLTQFSLIDFIDNDHFRKVKSEIQNSKNHPTVLIGTGTDLLMEPDLLIYFDMPRWEIIQRFRKDEISNLFLNNKNASFEEQYKRSYFFDWRLCDKHKRKLYNRIDYIVDTVNIDNPVMITGNTFRSALDSTVNQPFELVPFFDPGPWGGQWMKDICDLDKEVSNFAWCFNCVPEENSILFKFGTTCFETPAINLVFYKSRELLGEKVYEQFGAEFPIRFDFLDTMDGGNLSLQVHPTTRYIKENFNIDYTQDESYYIVDAKPDAKVFLGLKEDVQKAEMFNELKNAQENTHNFEAERFVNTWDAKMHDHFLIPGGTVHCSGKNCMVLEISSTPYIFTFKLWDWNRLGLNGKPRPINIEHGENVIQMERNTTWVRENLINRTETLEIGKNWQEEKTGLHELEFIETRRHIFTDITHHKTNNNLNVLCLVEGDQIVVESPESKFRPFKVNYAEVFIVPANIDEYTIRPANNNGKKHITIKAFVR